MKDLVLLAADKNMQAALRGALNRPLSLDIRPITFDFRVHPGRDGGVRTTGPEVIAGEVARFRHAIVIFDLEGSGAGIADSVEVESRLDARLKAQWEERAKCIVVDPEVDIWLWGADTALRQLLDWSRPGTIRDWLGAGGFEFNANNKPRRPKEAFEEVVTTCGLARSSALYEKVTSKISLHRCRDSAFLRLRKQLQSWFPAD